MGTLSVFGAAAQQFIEQRSSQRELSTDAAFVAASVAEHPRIVSSPSRVQRPVTAMGTVSSSSSSGSMGPLAPVITHRPQRVYIPAPPPPPPEKEKPEQPTHAPRDYRVHCVVHEAGRGNKHAPNYRLQQIGRADNQAPAFEIRNGEQTAGVQAYRSPRTAALVASAHDGAAVVSGLSREAAAAGGGGRGQMTASALARAKELRETRERGAAAKVLVPLVPSPGCAPRDSGSRGKENLPEQPALEVAALIAELALEAQAAESYSVVDADEDELTGVEFAHGPEIDANVREPHNDRLVVKVGHRVRAQTKAWYANVAKDDLHIIMRGYFGKPRTTVE
ncbi:hypothetical protein AURDEDRAFT_176945 [Auricularia subglabra TFB-10046 SS5]|uniref:Uncharacterized protein n=1 Tax=Auricularia subglabra (strain TFB-10046 / SS5) TaxID=717982 RepID=J0WQ58_AURST|nr:hypothetical protein AURDEDRAFT_176945 [Auricularia subglabra TFB-10046 SS5]